MTTAKKIARGKPAEYDQEIVKRRFRLTAAKTTWNDKRVLDFGCGNGAQTILFSDLNCNIDALDVEENQLNIFKNYIHENNIERINLHHYNGKNFPFPSDFYDVVLSYEVLEHVEDESSSLNEIRRVLKPDGEIIISVPNKGWIFETHGAYLPLLPWNRVPFFSWLPHSIHGRFAKARIYRKRDIVKLLSDHGFEVKSAEYITAPMDVVQNERLKMFLRNKIFTFDTTKLSILSTSILVHAGKLR